MANPFAVIGKFFKKVGVAVSQGFIHLFGKDAAHKFADASLDILKTAAGVIVMDAVQIVEAMNPLMSGSDKRLAAFDRIAADCKKQGISITSQVINLLIEICVARMNNQFAPA